MAADANIFQQYLQPVKSVQDYSNSFDKQEQNALTLAALRLQGQQGQQAQADDQAQRQAAMDAGGDQNALVKALMGRGLIKQAQAVQAAGLTNAKTQADTSLANAHAANYGQTTATGAYELEQKKRVAAAARWASFSSPKDALADLQGKVQSGEVAPEQAAAIAQSIPQDPAEFAKWQLAHMKEFLSPKDRVALEVPDANTVANNTQSGKNNAATVGATIRGQNLTDSRARELLNQGKVPAGYRTSPDGNLAAIPGGPADLKLQGVLNQDTQSLTSSTAAMDRLATAANEALNHPGLAGTAGLRGAIPNIPGSNAADAAALLNTLKSQVAFGVLQDMRNNSKTGGALGSVSDAEGKRLEANLAALEKSQSVDQLKTSLQKIVEYTTGAKDRLRGAYNLKHGQGNAAPSSQPAVTNGGATVSNW